MSLVEPVGVGSLRVARQLDAVAPHVAGDLDGVVEQLAADPRVPQVVTHVHRLDLGASPASVLDVAERQQLEHPHDVDAVVDGDEHRRVRVVLDLAERGHVVVAMREVVVVSDELAPDDQRNERVGIVGGCGAQRDFHDEEQ